MLSIIMFLGAGVLAVVLGYLIKGAVDDARASGRGSPNIRLMQARQQVRRVFRDAERQMDDAAGEGGGFDFGSRSEWR